MNKRQPTDLEGAVAIVTGGGRGLGRALAMAMAGRGVSVAVVARTAEEIRRVSDEVRALGVNAIPCQADIGRWGQVREMVERVVSTMGHVDILVNNAAVVTPVGPVYRLDPTSWEHALSTNLFGTFSCTRAVVEHMISRGGGKILTIVSGMGVRVFPHFSAYSVCKAGLIHLTRILAAELRGVGIQVNSIDPGMVDTSMHEQLRAMPVEDIGDAMHNQLVYYKEQGLLRPPEHAASLIVEFMERSSLEASGELFTLADIQRALAGLV